MKQHLLPALLVILLINGCWWNKAPTAQPPAVVFDSGGYDKLWQADLSLYRDPVKALHLREDALIVYTRDNRGYWLSASGGAILGFNQIANQDHSVYPPVTLTDYIAIPTTLSIQTFNKSGKRLNAFETATAIQSGGAGVGNSLFLGVSHPGSGRLTRFDVEQTLVAIWEMWTSDGIVATPATFGDAIFAGGVDGKVWAVTTNRAGIWSMPGNAFQTDGPITAPLSADEYGVYVASQDKKLYCLDRSSGRIKWSYYAGLPLLEQPLVIGNTVYQFVPNRGLSAINKTEGAFSREPMWVQPLAQQILATDEKYLYVRSGRGTVVALDKATGTPQFQSGRSDLVVFATNLTSPTIYAATNFGTIMAIRPIPQPGAGNGLALVPAR